MLANAPCVDYSDVCVPAQSMQTGCRCALIRPGQQSSAAITLRHLLALHNRTKRETFEEIRFSILQQSGVDELNRFFPSAESESVGVDNNVFASMNTQVCIMLLPYECNDTQQKSICPKSPQNQQNGAKSILMTGASLAHDRISRERRHRTRHVRRLAHARGPQRASQLRLAALRGCRPSYGPHWRSEPRPSG